MIQKRTTINHLEKCFLCLLVLLTGCALMMPGTASAG